MAGFGSFRNSRYPAAGDATTTPLDEPVNSARGRSAIVGSGSAEGGRSDELIIQGRRQIFDPLRIRLFQDEVSNECMI